MDVLMSYFVCKKSYLALATPMELPNGYSNGATQWHLILYLQMKTDKC